MSNWIGILSSVSRFTATASMMDPAVGSESDEYAMGSYQIRFNKSDNSANFSQRSALGIRIPTKEVFDLRSNISYSRLYRIEVYGER